MFKKSFILVLLMFLSSTQIVADETGADMKSDKQSNNAQIDIYDFVYDSKTKECILKRNSKEIELFDKRFGEKKKPKATAYSCAAWVKEQYSRCQIVENVHTSALALSFGRYSNTNLLVAFKNEHETIDAKLVLECTR